MTTMGNDTVLISFPELLPAFRREPVSGVRYLDPGLSADLEPGVRYAPDGLPLTAEQAARWLAQATGYAGLFEPGALRAADAAAKAPGANPWGDPTSAIISELKSMEGVGVVEKGRDATLLRAQTVLLLAWERERGLAEVSELGDGYGGVLERFGQSLGLEPEDMDELAVAASGLALRTSEFPYAVPAEWQPVLAAMLQLLPPQAVLFVDAPSVVTFWREAGVHLEPVSGERLAALLPDAPVGEYLLARCPGNVLMGTTRVPDDAPWLASERTVLVREQAAGE